MIEIKKVETDADVRGIISLQKKNLKKNLTPSQIESQGFVTVEHEFATLLAMNQAEPSIVAKVDNTVVGYCLTMLPNFGQQVPELVGMFELFSQIEYKNKPLNSYPYYVAGQVCVAESYRGLKLLDAMYAKHQEVFSEKYKLMVTEIAVSNTRSMRVHERIGFETIHQYHDPKINDTWAIVVWDWQTS